MATPLKIALIAGEISGDQLGGWLMQSLKKANPHVRFIGVGGERMQDQGLLSLFSMQELSLMGVFEILPHIFSLKRRIRETIAYLKTEKPDVLITIDSPGFNFRIAKALREMNPRPRLIHYVAPSVWSHRPERAKKIAALYDHLLVIFPFEPPYFEREGLRTSFIGHQVAWEWKTRGDGAAFRQHHNIPADAPLLAVFPGSRNAELKRMLPAIRGAVTSLYQQVSGLHIVVQVPGSLKNRLMKATSDWPVRPPLILSNTEEKKGLFAASTAALSKSGTVALECALAGLPAIITYKANALSVWLVRRLLTIRYAHIANLIADREIVPELIQERCTAKELSAALRPLLTSHEAREQQRTALSEFATTLGATDSNSPSDKAAALILSGL